MPVVPRQQRCGEIIEISGGGATRGHGFFTASSVVGDSIDIYRNLMSKTPRRKRLPHDPTLRKERGLLAVGASLPTIAAPALRKRGFAQAKLITEWPAIAGGLLARETVPQKLVFPRGIRGDGILHLRVSSGFALELHHIAPQLIERINAFFGYQAVANLRYQQGPIPPLRKPRRIGPKRLANNDEARLQRNLEAIENPELRKALADLGRAVRVGREPR